MGTVAIDLSRAKPIGGGVTIDLTKAKPIAGAAPRPAGLPDGVDLPPMGAPPTPPQLDPRDQAIAAHPFTGGFDYDTRDVRANGGDNGGSRVKAAVQNTLGRAARGTVGLVAHPLDAATGLGSTVKNAVLHPSPYDPENPAAQAVTKYAEDFRDNGAGAAIPHIIGDAAGMYLGGEALKPVANIGRAMSEVPSGVLAGSIDEPMVGTSTTPRQRYNSAKNLGVNLDAADATNSGPLKMVKKFNEHSLFGGPTYDANRARNLESLHSSTDDALRQMYNGDRESGGAAIQTALKNNQAGLQADATAGFQSLPQDHPIPGSVDLGYTAQDIAKTQAPYQAKFPSLIPKQANAIVGDVSKLAPSLPPGVQGPLPAGSPSDFGTMQQLRSDLLESGRSNPDLIKNQSGGWMQRMAGGADTAMTDASTGLPSADQATFRDANSKWEDMKGTYDDPNSPLYWAVRKSSPSELYGGNSLGERTPEAVRDLIPRLGGSSSPATGALRRGTVESALKTTNDGSPNFKGFGTQLNRIPADYRAELYTLPQNQALRDISTTGNVLHADFNPSGTAKQGQKVAEAVSFIPTGGLPALHYPVAKMMNSPAITDYLMRPPTPVAPTAGSAANYLPFSSLPFAANSNPPRKKR